MEGTVVTIYRLLTASVHKAVVHFISAHYRRFCFGVLAIVRLTAWFFLQHPSFGRTRRLTRRIQGPFPGICSYVRVFTFFHELDPHGFYYWISRAFVSERRHLESRLLVVPGHITRSFVGVWPLVPLFAAVAFHEMDNYPNRVAILRWTAAFEPSLFYWGLLLIPPGYYIDDDGDFVVY
ncbi:hypothetical protein F5141DRAFT_1066315 [Pisolithus sp. B1]|nr:hypothetical protein F5141DRAFT_1066315 [Pisolithus sp. B1]